MKVAILTLPLHKNYGGILQAYALSRVLRSMGHETVVLNRDEDTIYDLGRMPKLYAKRIVKKIIGRKCERLFEEHCEARERPVVRAELLRFVNDKITLRQCERLTPACVADVDAVVVGSDQVWRKVYFKRMWKSGIDDAFGAFVPSDMKLVAYAPSFGTDVWEYDVDETRKCAEAAKRFVAMSVREDSGTRLCAEHLGVQAATVLDPTMLLTREDYCNLIDEADTVAPTGGVFNYILDPTPDKERLVKKICTLTGSAAYGIRLSSRDYHLPPVERRLPSVEQWLRSFRDARFVVTDSFHACVFSILFGKPFVAAGNSVRGNSRFESLLERFGLSDRLVTEMPDNMSLDIDYEHVGNLLAAEREKSLAFLRKIET